MTTVTTTTTAMAPSSAVVTVRKPRVALYTICVIFGFLSFISIVGSMLFSYPLGGFLGYSTGIMLDIGGVLMAYTAYKLPRGGWNIYKLAVGLMLAEFGWSVYKVFIYHESESQVFFVANVIALVLLLTGPVRRYSASVRP
jgi:hypothetical protein